MNRIILCFIILSTLFLSISAISASEDVAFDNLTAVVEDNDDLVTLNENADELFSSDNRTSTEISSEDKISYVDYEDKFTVKLTSNGSILSNKSILIKFNNVEYDKTTDLNGQVDIDFKLKSGVYAIDYSFMGDEDYAPSNGTSTLTVENKLVTSFTVVDKDIVYREGLKSIFQIKLVDIYGNIVAKESVTIKVGGKTYSAKTNSKGIATFYLSLGQGTYNVQYHFSQNSRYVNSSSTYKISVKAKLSKGDGYWVNLWSMKKVNLKKLSKLGTKHIFLLHAAISKYGKNDVLNWIKKAHKYGMKVHLWISVFYKNGKYISPVSKKGVFNYKYMNKIIRQVKGYAKLNGGDGIHFDYVRFPGTAYKYKNSVKAVNYFIKKACVNLRSVNPDIIVSAAVMPEPTSMKYYYAQDIPTMSKYLDAILPMIYKGNYHAGSKWIKKTTKQFVKQSKGSLIWAGLQSYKSDSNIKKLSYKELFNDAKAAKKGGASGIVLFRWGLSPLLNFNKL
ncbi:putative glycoside hydrolase [Methanobrevibacter sp.]|uniref:putative glycoside hydrolase n=1 Tax=Methanobrevibacter sp. TaxID=66852 RepID=UPI00386A5D0B